MPASDIPIKYMREHIKKIFDAQKETIDGFGAHLQKINESVSVATTKLGELSTTYDSNKKMYEALKTRLKSETQQADADMVRLNAELADETQKADETVAQLTLEIKNLQDQETKAKEAKAKEAKAKVQSPAEIEQAIAATEAKILANITGAGVPNCTGFRIRDDIIITALHCCSNNTTLKQDSLVNPNCKVGDTSGGTWSMDPDLMKYFNDTHNDADDINNVDGVPNSRYYRDIMILKKNGEQKSDEMIVSILPEAEDLKLYEFKVAVRDSTAIKKERFIMLNLPVQQQKKDGELMRSFIATENIKSGMSGSGVFAYKKETSEVYYYGAMSASVEVKGSVSRSCNVYSLHDLESLSTTEPIPSGLTPTRGHIRVMEKTIIDFFENATKDCLKYILHTKKLKPYPQIYPANTSPTFPAFDFTAYSKLTVSLKKLKDDVETADSAKALKDVEDMEDMIAASAAKASKDAEDALAAS